MKTTLFVSTALLSLGLIGCGNLAPEAAFSTSADINGANPEAAIFPLFGVASDTVIDSDGDGAPDTEASVFLLVASDDPELCQVIGNDAQDAEAFFEAAKRGFFPGTIVLHSTFRIGELPVAGDVLQGISDDVESFSFFLVSDGVVPQVLSLSSEADSPAGRLEVEELIEGQTFSGFFSDLLTVEDVTAQAISVELTGEIRNAEHCQVLTDFAAAQL